MRTPDRATVIKHRPLSFLFNPYIFVKETETGYEFDVDWGDCFSYAFDSKNNDTIYPNQMSARGYDQARMEAACEWLDNLGAERLYALLMGADKARPVFK